MSTGFHLPHNAILPEEVKFIIGLIDPNREYYLYDDLKAMMFEEEIRQGVFEKFHPGMYRNFMTDEDALRIFKEVTGLPSVSATAALPKVTRNNNIRMLKKKGLTVKQISRVMAVSTTTVKRICSSSAADK